MLLKNAIQFQFPRLCLWSFYKSVSFKDSLTSPSLMKNYKFLLLDNTHFSGHLVGLVNLKRYLPSIWENLLVHIIFWIISFFSLFCLPRSSITQVLYFLFWNCNYFLSFRWTHVFIFLFCVCFASSLSLFPLSFYLSVSVFFFCLDTFFTYLLILGNLLLLKSK